MTASQFTDYLNLAEEKTLTGGLSCLFTIRLATFNLKIDALSGLEFESSF